MPNKAYVQYCEELTSAYSSAMASLDTCPRLSDTFELLTPFWTFLGTATHESIAINPTKELLLSRLSSTGDMKKFLAVSADKRFERLYANELRDATKAVAFTSYFDELVSDSICLINAIAVYDYRMASIALRCMLEDLYRHLYYKDNREYFIRVHELGESEFSLDIAPKDFRKHLRGASYLHPLFDLLWGFVVRGTTVKGFHALNDSLYSAASASAHGASPKLLNQFATNTDRLSDIGRATAVYELVRLFVMLANAFLLFAHKDYFARFNEADKRVVLSSFATPQRIEIRKRLGV
jgi:hypothetical protein